MGRENTFGTIVGTIAPCPFTYCRVSTDDLNGRITSYVGEGEFTKDKVQSFGGYGVIKIPRFQDLLKHICTNGLEPHVAASRAPVADAIEDALKYYMQWDVYHHR